MINFELFSLFNKFREVLSDLLEISKAIKYTHWAYYMKYQQSLFCSSKLLENNFIELKI